MRMQAKCAAKVTFNGLLEPEGSVRAEMQNLVFDVASAWANCDRDVMKSAMAADVDFPYPTSRVQGVEAVLADLEAYQHLCSG